MITYATLQAANLTKKAIMVLGSIAWRNTVYHILLHDETLPHGAVFIFFILFLSNAFV
jgi:hypothetical protein